MVPLFSKADFNKFLHNVQHEVTLICAKFGKDLFSISEVIGHKTKWPRFFWPTLYVINVCATKHRIGCIGHIGVTGRDSV